MANITSNTTLIPSAPETFFSSVSVPWMTGILTLFVLYASLCSFLRFQRRDGLQKKFGFPDKKSLERMTNEEAQKIMEYLAELEFPKFYEMSVQFALFKTYGIPTISSLLLATKEFSSVENANKRYADTSVLIVEFSAHPPKDERAIKAIARMNYIHSRYIKAGKISNEDLLYTLSVFITEPVSWIARYEWRSLSDMEICAISTFWKSIGDSMGIQYEPHLSPTTWKSGLDFYNDISSWAERYEEAYMVPAIPNKKTADELVPLLLFYVPKFAKPFAADAVGVMMGDRLRASMMYSTPAPTTSNIVHSILNTRRFLLRYLALPRPNWMNVRKLSEPDPKTGKLYMTTYQAAPYYIKPGWLNRWGPEAWFVWAAGGKVPSSSRVEYQPGGYDISEIGPRSMKGKGLAEGAEIEDKLRKERPLGCPFR